VARRSNFVVVPSWAPVFPCRLAGTCRLLLQILDLGVTRLLVHRLVRVFPYICEGYYPLCETIWATFRVANKRIEFMGRRSRASRLPPGYACIVLLLYRDAWWPFCTMCLRRPARGGQALCHVLFLDV